MIPAIWVVGIEPVLAVNVALVALAGTVTEAGSMRTLAMAPEIVTTTPPAGAAPAKVTVQVVVALEVRVDAAHWTEETSVGALRERLNSWEEPLRDAVMVAVRAVEMVPVLAVNVALVALAGTVTEAGNVRMPAMPPAIVTAAPPAGAAPFKVTVQVVLPLEDREAAAQWTEETSTSAVSERVVVGEEPLRDAVMVAVRAVEMVPVLAVNVALVALAGTVTEAGNVRMPAMPPAIVTAAPPAGAAPFKVTVQVVLPLEDREAAAQWTEETTTSAVSERVVVGEEPLRDAVMVAVRAVEMVPVLAVNVALVALAGTVTEAGNVRMPAMPPAIVTTAPPAGAAPFKVTVQVVLPLEDREAAAQWTEEISTGPDGPVVNVIQVPEI
jgi:hypothetical protein